MLSNPTQASLSFWPKPLLPFLNQTSKDMGIINPQKIKLLLLMVPDVEEKKLTKDKNKSKVQRRREMQRNKASTQREETGWRE